MANLLNQSIVDWKITETNAGTWKEYRDVKLGYYREFTSRRVVMEMPLLHYTNGINPETGTRKTARGFIAIGKKAVGIFAVGQLAVGVVAIGQLALGVCVLGQAALGVLLGVGQLATGCAALGQFAIGIVCMGQIVIGYKVLAAQLDLVHLMMRNLSVR